MAIDIKLVLEASTQKALSKINALDKDADKLKERFASIGKASGVAFASVAAGVGLAVRSFATFDNKMRGVQTLLDKTSFGAKSLEQGFKDMSAEALALSAEVPVAIESLTDALFDTVSAGVSAGEAVEVLGVSSKLAVAGLTDVATATNGMTSALNAYSLGSEEAEAVAAKFFAAQKQGKTTIAELSDGFGLVGATAAATGVSLDELLSSVSAVTTAGIKTNAAYTGMKAVLSNILKPTKDAADEAKRLGVEFNAGALKAKGLKGFLDSLTSATGFTQDSITQLFGSVEAQNIVFALAGNQAKNFADNLKILGNETKAIATFTDAFTIQNASLKNQLIILTNKFNAFSTVLGQEFAPMVLKATEAIGGLLDKISENKDLIKYGAIAVTAAGGVAALGVAVSGLGFALTPLAGILGFSVLKTLGLTTAVSALAGVLGIGVAKLNEAEEATEKESEAVIELQKNLDALREEQDKNNTKLEDNTSRVYINKKALEERNEVLKEQITQSEILLQQTKKFQNLEPISLMRPDDSSAEGFDPDAMFAPLREANINHNKFVIEGNRDRLATIEEQELAAAVKEKERKKLKEEAQEAERLARQEALAAEMEQLESELMRRVITLDQFAMKKAKLDQKIKAAGIKDLKTELKTRAQLEDQDRKARASAFNAENLKKLKDTKNSNEAIATLNQIARSAETKMVGEALGNLASLQQSGDRKLFILGKAAALAKVAVNTAVGVSRAMAEGGPFLGPALAATMIAAGAMQASTIASTAFAQGGLVEGGVPGRDSVNMIAQRGEVVAPRSNFAEVIGSVRAKREADKIAQFDTGEDVATTEPMQLEIGFTDNAFEIIENKLIERQAIGISNL